LLYTAAHFGQIDIAEYLVTKHNASCLVADKVI
jgi:hypothetical protein